MLDLRIFRPLLAAPLAMLAACGSSPESGANPAPAAFAQCSACHQVAPDRNGAGPTLAGVFGAQAGHISGYRYSDAMRASGIVWDETSLDAYLRNPRAVVSGTTMAYPGLDDDAKRKAIIEYLKTL